MTAAHAEAVVIAAHPLIVAALALPRTHRVAHVRATLWQAGRQAGEHAASQAADEVD